MNKLNRILLGVLGLQILLVLFVFLRGDETGVGTLEPLLAGVDGAKVERVRIFDRTAKSAAGTPGEEEDGGAQGKGDKPAIDMVKKGDAWVLASHFDYQIEAQKVTDLLDKIEGLRSRAPIAAGKARQKQLEVADDSYQRKVVITAGGKDTSFYVGSSAGQRQTSVRLAGSDSIHGVMGLTAQGVGARPSNWVDAGYVDVPTDRVVSFDVVNGKGSFRFERSGDTWQVTADGQPVKPAAGMELNKGEIDKLINRATKVNLAEPADPKRAIDKPLATVTLHLKPEQAAEQEQGAGADAGAQESTAESAGEERVIEIAGSDKKDRNYVREKGRAQAALVDALSITDIVELSRDRLTQKIDDKKPAEGEQPMEGLPPGLDPGGLPPGMPPGMDPGMVEQ